MADRNLRNLLESVARQDWAAARINAETIVRGEEKRGNHVAARVLREALLAPSNATTVGSLLNLGLIRTETASSLQDVVLSNTLRKDLTDVIDEFRFADKLRSRNLQPRQKLLFSGPPGCGKTLTSRALACELNLPHFIVRFDSLIGAYLGQTATNLRQVFRFAEQTRCVLVFDEIDAVGKTRGSTSDIGELDRIVIALMQELDISRPLGMIVAASNLPDALDRALLRRFDTHLSFDRPSPSTLKKFARSTVAKYGERLSPRALELASRQASFGEAEKVVLDYVRHRILDAQGETNGEL